MTRTWLISKLYIKIHRLISAPRPQKRVGLNEHRLLYWVSVNKRQPESVCSHLWKEEWVVVYVGQRLNKVWIYDTAFILKDSNRAVATFSAVNTDFFPFGWGKEKEKKDVCGQRHTREAQKHVPPLSYIPQWDLTCHILSQLLESCPKKGVQSWRETFVKSENG